MAVAGSIVALYAVSTLVLDFRSQASAGLYRVEQPERPRAPIPHYSESSSPVAGAHRKVELDTHPGGLYALLHPILGQL